MRRLSLLAAFALPLALASQVNAAGPVGVRSFKSGPIQVTADGRWVWVADTHADGVSRIDTRDQSVTTFVLPDRSVVDSPRGVSVTEDGSEVWVACHDSDRVYVLDGATGAVKSRVDLPWGSGPYSVALSRPDGTGRQRWALVTLHRAPSLAAIDTATRQVTLLGDVFYTPFGIAWTEDGNSAWVNHLLVTDEHPILTRVDISGSLPKVATRIGAFAATPQFNPQLKDADPAKNVAEGGYLNYRGHPAQVPSETGRQQLWLPTQYHNMHADGFTPDSTIQVSLRRFDLTQRKLLVDDKVVLSAKSVHDPNGGQNNPAWLGWGWDAGISGAVDIAFAHLGGKLQTLILAEQSDDVVVFPWDIPRFRSATDPNAPKLPEVRVGNRPMGLAVSPTDPVAYVYNDLSFDVSVVDVTDPAHPHELRRIALSPPLPSDAVSDPVLLRGARLFFTSADPRVSGNEKVSCASCHINGESDGRTWGLQKTPAGTAGQRHGPRVTTDLLGLGKTFISGQRDTVTGYGELHHSGDRDEVQDFEHTFRGPQMGGTGFLGAAVQPELGAPNAGRDPDLDALARWMSTVEPLPHSPHRDPGGFLSEAAVRGATYFMGAAATAKPADADCASCHVPETGFVDHQFHDVGSRRPSEELELNDTTVHGKCLWCVNTPTLIGAWARPHLQGAYTYATGMLDLLADFNDPGRNKPHGHLSQLTVRQTLDLAEFVQSLDGNTDALAVRQLRDTSPPRFARVSPTSRTRVEVWFDETVDPVSAANPANYRLTDVATGAVMPVAAATFDRQNGDHVSLTTALAASAAGTNYRLVPAGGIRDAADAASGGVANTIDPTDPRNTQDFVLGDRLTITLGASGYENLTIPVMDASPIGPGLSTWGNDRAALSMPNGVPNPGLIRFQWQDAFAAATGVTNAADILDASFSALPSDGDAQAIEIRRVLQTWADPPGTHDYNQNPTGGPTWRDHSHPDKPWNQPGAQALGGRGDKTADYDGHNDLAETVDAVTTLVSINERATFVGPPVTDAFRFWLAHPHQDYGYALRLKGTPGTGQTVFFHGADLELHQKGPVLTLTYRLSSGAAPTLAPTATPTPHEGGDHTATPTPHEGGDHTATPTPHEGGDHTATPTPHEGGDHTATPTPHEGGDRTATPTPHEGGDRTATPTPHEGGDHTATPTPHEGGDRTATPTPREGGDRPHWHIYMPHLRKWWPDSR